MVKKRKTQINIYIMLEKSVNNKKNEKKIYEGIQRKIKQN